MVQRRSCGKRVDRTQTHPCALRSQAAALCCVLGRCGAQRGFELNAASYALSHCCYHYYFAFFFLFLGDKNKIQKLVQMAWTFVNDRYVCSSVDLTVVLKIGRDCMADWIQAP